MKATEIGRFFLVFSPRFFFSETVREAFAFVAGQTICFQIREPFRNRFGSSRKKDKKKPEILGYNDRMQLMIDVGNSSASFTLFEGETVKGRLSFLHDEGIPLDSLRAFLPEEPFEAFLASVAPKKEEALLAALEKLGVKPFVLTKEIALRALPANVDSPAEVGIDLLLDALGTEERDAIIIDLGTCNKVIYKKDGMFGGVAISPGFSLAYQSIFGNAEMIPSARLSFSDAPIGKNTPDALSSGILVAGVKGLLALAEAIDPAGNTPRILTGGAASALLSLFPDWRHEPDLLATGMKRLSETLS